jgi:hypothetical protein
MCILHLFCSFSPYIIDDLFHIGSYWFILCAVHDVESLGPKNTLVGQTADLVFSVKIIITYCIIIKQNKQSAEHFHDA